DVQIDVIQHGFSVKGFAHVPQLKDFLHSHSSPPTRAKQKSDMPPLAHRLQTNIPRRARAQKQTRTWGVGGDSQWV
ncbi:MAG: hypothetical protein LUG15_03125, partial [Oscillospiraceae bacterium]|nr:hypothetical protein [Oscillospiraceae bacterium]